MEAISYTQIALSFVFILSLIGLIAFVLKKINNSSFFRPKGKHIVLEEVFYMDSKHKVVSIRKKNKVYTMLVGQSSVLMDVETDE